MACGAIGVVGEAVRKSGRVWADAILVHGILATISALACVFLTVNLVFLALQNKILGRTCKLIQSMVQIRGL